MIIIGSTAIKKFYPEFREPKDVDILCYKKEFDELNFDKSQNDNTGRITLDKVYEFQFINNWPSYKHLLTVTDSAFRLNTEIGSIKCLPPFWMMILKKSHLYRSLSFYKHIKDFHFLEGKMSWASVFGNDYARSVYLDILKDTKSKFPDKTPSLSKSKEAFFNDYVIKYVEHDWIHEQIAFYDRPLYERCQNAEVFCSKKLWEQLDFEDKIKMVQEEALAIAIERKIIPLFMENKCFSLFYKSAFYYAVGRICTNLCRGWFREFAQLNWPKVVQCDYENIISNFMKEFEDVYRSN